MSATSAQSSKLLSVIIAGGTGSTGRELVSKLVAHPKIGRVVVLSRHAIPVNRWQTFFPNLRTADALRHLSIVDVNWSKLLDDTQGIPLNMLKGVGVDDEDEISDVAPTMDSGAVSRASSKSIGVVSDLEGNPLDEEIEQPSPASALHRSRYFRGRKELIGAAAAAKGGAKQRKSDTDDVSVVTTSTSLRRTSRRKLQALTRSSYYRSVFSGHHVAINCLGSHSILNPWGVAAVDHDYAMAFAKLVRLFNCYLEDREAEAAADEAEALLEAAQLADDGVAWKEICAAYLGSDGVALSASNQDQELVLDDFLSQLAKVRKTQSSSSTITATPTSGGGLQLRQGPSLRRPTLVHYAQVSTAGAGYRSPMPYFRAHGICDQETAALFATPPPPVSSPNFPTALNPDLSSGRSSTTSVLSVPGFSGAGTFINPRTVDIYKPGLLKRPNARWWETVLQVFALPVTVEHLSSILVEDILEQCSDIVTTTTTTANNNIQSSNTEAKTKGEETRRASAALSNVANQHTSDLLIEHHKQNGGSATQLRTIGAKRIHIRAHIMEAAAAEAQRGNNFNWKQM